MPAGTRRLDARSWGPARASLRLSTYTPDSANDSTICVVMIVTTQAVEHAADILAVPGIDAVYIGPWDLPSRFTRGPRTLVVMKSDRQAIAAVRDAAQACGVTPGIACGGISHVSRWIRGRVPDDRSELRRRDPRRRGFVIAAGVAQCSAVDGASGCSNRGGDRMKRLRAKQVETYHRDGPSGPTGRTLYFGPPRVLQRLGLVPTRDVNQLR